MKSHSKRNVVRKVAPALMAGLGVALFYLLLAIYDWIAEGETLEVWYAIFLGCLFLGVASLSLASSFLSWLILRTMGRALPLSVGLLWGTGLGVVCAMILDLPGINFYRWQLYAAAASAGFLAALVNHGMKSQEWPLWKQDQIDEKELL